MKKQTNKNEKTLVTHCCPALCEARRGSWELCTLKGHLTPAALRVLLGKVGEGAALAESCICSGRLSPDLVE